MFTELILIFLFQNIIYHDVPGFGPGVTFIDFEYAAFNFQAFDIANHFCEFAGVETFDPSRHPDVAFQKKWLKNYLKAWKKLQNCRDSHTPDSTSSDETSDDEVSEEQVSSLLEQVKKFTLASHLLWGIWALIQSRHSKIDFDFQSYAQQRIDQYYAEKQKVYPVVNGTCGP